MSKAIADIHRWIWQEAASSGVRRDGLNFDRAALHLQSGPIAAVVIWEATMPRMPAQELALPRGSLGSIDSLLNNKAT